MSSGRPKGAVPMPGVPELDIVDLVADGRTDLLSAWTEVHLRHFPDYPHVVDEVVSEVQGNPMDPDVRAHVWLGFDALTHAPVAEFAFDTNLARGAVLNHYSAVDESTRRTLDPSWLRHLIDSTQSVARDEARAAGIELRLQVTEVPARHARGWPRHGLHPLPVSYGEPRHGRNWAKHGDPEFLPITLMMRRAPGGAGLDYGDLARSAAEAFLLDHYRLPRDHPEVERMLAEAEKATEPAAR